MPNSWKPEMLVDGKWCDNTLRFPTEQEAGENALALLMRWTVPTDSRAVESDDLPNYNWIDGRLEPIKPGDVA
jgi:hypothetical protein